MPKDANEAMERACRACGDRLRPGARPDAVFCSTTCRSRQWRVERRLRRRLAAVQSGVGEGKCRECGARWVAGVDRRFAAVYCSPKCKVRAWRRRNDPFADRSQ